MLDFESAHVRDHFHGAVTNVAEGRAWNVTAERQTWTRRREERAAATPAILQMLRQGQARVADARPPPQPQRGVPASPAPAEGPAGVRRAEQVRCRAAEGRPEFRGVAHLF